MGKKTTVIEYLGTFTSGLIKIIGTQMPVYITNSMLDFCKDEINLRFYNDIDREREICKIKEKLAIKDGKTLNVSQIDLLIEELNEIKDQMEAMMINEKLIK